MKGIDHFSKGFNNMELKDNRKDDHNAECAFAKFLDRRFYPYVSKHMGYDRFMRETRVQEQCNGCDVMLFNESFDAELPLRIDEKASITYCNGRPLHTFLMELSCISQYDGKEYDGWFVNDKSITDMYALVTNIRANFIEYGEITEDSFDSATIMMVRKSVIMDYLAQRGLTIDVLKSLPSKLRKGNISHKWQNPTTGSFEWDFEFDVNTNLSTTPVSIKLNNGLLQRLCDYRFYVKNDDCMPIIQLPKIEENSDGLIYKYIKTMTDLKTEITQLKQLINTQLNNK